MPDVGQFIRDHSDAILAAWRQEAGTSASARGLTRPELSNVIPKYLHALAEAGAELGEFTGTRRRHVETHLATRLRLGFHLAEIIEEFALLGRVIANSWAAFPAEQRPSPESTRALFAELHAASASVAEMYTRHMLEDEQTEKRYLRLIRNVAFDALQTGGVPLRSRLQEVVELVLEAMAAQSAALLLFERETEQLVTVAAAGDTGTKLAEQAAGIDPAAFAGQVASSSDDSVSTMDASSAELEVSPALQRSGIRSLLGVRLPPRHRLVGVLYVGIADRRAFTPRETRRLETLGEHLTLYLDNARLYADLVEKIERLATERELRERFVSVLAHDLRGPLSAAKIGAHLLVLQPDTTGKRRDLAIKVEYNIDRTETMVRDLLDANRIRAGERLQLKIVEADLASITQQVVEELQAVHPRRFVLEAEPGIRGHWSVDDLRRAIWNLGTNAVKYGAPDAPITFRVQRSRLGASVSVHNIGDAISEEDRRRIFRPFSRAPSAQAGPIRGWGLGLTLVRGCAEAHGGTVEVSSDRETGTTFTIELPLDARPHQAQVAADAGERPPAAPH